MFWGEQHTRPCSKKPIYQDSIRGILLTTPNNPHAHSSYRRIKGKLAIVSFRRPRIRFSPYRLPFISAIAWRLERRARAAAAVGPSCGELLITSEAGFRV